LNAPGRASERNVGEVKKKEMETLRNNHLSVFFSLSPLSLVRVCLFVKPATQSVNVRDKRQLLRETPKKATRENTSPFFYFIFHFWLLLMQ
jgi:hypothetical protein